MTPSTSFRLNQYNWFGHKLLVQNRYDDLLHLRHNLSRQDANSGGALDDVELPMSDHLTYITGIVLMKTSTRLDELIYTLQKLNFQKNGNYFLLLCQCLLYLGNHDTVVALCKQTLNREIDATPPAQREVSISDQLSKSFTSDAEILDDGTVTSEIGGSDNQASGQQAWCLQQLYEESIEFKKMLEIVARNPLINDPRLWFLFALSLEFQLQFEDANVVHRVACKLAAGQATQISNSSGRPSKQTSAQPNDGGHDAVDVAIGISNYYTPHKSYSEFIIRYQGDYRTAMQILGQAARISPPINYTLNPALALTLCSQANSNVECFSKALEMINSLDNHSVSLRNPSFVYNQLALKCKQKSGYQNKGRKKNCYDSLDRICDEQRFGLDYVLIKSHIVNNDIVQNFSNSSNLYKCPVTDTMSTRNTTKPDQIIAQIDNTIDTLRGSNSDCWASHALWNNLGVCYLLKRRYIASLSCLTKAHQINPIDWRINYNLSLVYLHVGLPARALCSALASKSLRPALSPSSHVLNYGNHLKPYEPITNTMIAISYSELCLVNEARRFYAEMIAFSRSSATLRTPLLALVNYLLLLHRDFSQVEKNSNDERNARSVTGLLDSIEQAWLQRNPNDSQFAQSILDLSDRIGKSQQRSKNQMKKAYAWTKFESSK